MPKVQLKPQTLEVPCSDVTTSKLHNQLYAVSNAHPQALGIANKDVDMPNLTITACAALIVSAWQYC